MVQIVNRKNKYLNLNEPVKYRLNHNSLHEATSRLSKITLPNSRESEIA